LFVVTILSPISALGQNTTDNMTLGNTTNETGIENATDVGKTSSLLGGGGGGGSDDGDCQGGAVFNNG
jgi:hypothetical protein